LTGTSEKGYEHQPVSQRLISKLEIQRYSI
jgi:hypothetical protein